MTIVAEQYQHVVGVDTHAATHYYAIVATATGAVIDTGQFPTSPGGLARAADWIARRTGGDVTGTLISSEGTGSYGAQAAELLTDRGYRVVEAPTPDAKRIRGKGKSDKGDAIVAARTALGTELVKLRDRRAGGLRAALQVLITRRDELNARRTAAVNALTALLRAHPLGMDARKKLTAAQIRQVAAWRTRTEEPYLALLRQSAIDYATDIRTTDQQLTANKAQIRPIVAEMAPQLLDVFGIGVINAAIILTVWSHPGRIRSPQAMAAIAGVAPIPIDSGNTHRTRLNRGGDRRLNRAIASIVLTRCRREETKAYIARRVADGKSKNDARRCLRTYMARKIHRLLTNPDAEKSTPVTID